MSKLASDLLKIRKLTLLQAENSGSSTRKCSKVESRRLWCVWACGVVYYQIQLFLVVLYLYFIGLTFHKRPMTRNKAQ